MGRMNLMLFFHSQGDFMGSVNLNFQAKFRWMELQIIYKL